MNRGGWIAWAVVVLLLAALVPHTVTARTVVINSGDWIDVYSGMLYARMLSEPSRFLTSKRYVTILPEVIPPGESIVLFESERVPYVPNLAARIQKQKYAVHTVRSSSGFGLNLALARELNATRFIIVDPTYGFNAVSVAPYAVLTNAFVIFVDGNNKDQVRSFLALQPRIDNLLIYGDVAEDVAEEFQRFSPERINTGNRYNDNADILKQYFAKNPKANQIIIADGTFLEQQLLGGEPVALVGKGRFVNPDTVAVIKNSPVRTGVVIGNDLTRSARQVKEATGISLFLKVGQGIPTGTAEYEPLKALDMFFLPTLNIQVDLAFVQYNLHEQSLEVVYRNQGSRAYLTGAFSILVDGETVQTVGDLEPQRIEANETKGFRYPIDLAQYFAANRNITADVFTVYGESPDIQDQAIATQVPIGLASAENQCDIELKDVTYLERTQRFAITLKNPTKNDCYASLSLQDVIINDRPQTLTYSETAVIPGKETATFKLKQRMTAVDLEDNPEVHVHALYGEKPGLLFKLLDEKVPLHRQRFDIVTILIIAVILILLALVIVLFVLWRRSKQERRGRGIPQRTNASIK